MTDEKTKVERSEIPERSGGKKRSPFGPSPFSRRSGEEVDTKGITRKGWSPFPRKLTPEEKKAKKLKKAKNRDTLNSMIEKGRYDKVTVMISKGLLEFIGLFMAKLYLTRSRMFNFMMVGASGAVINWFLYEGIFRPFCLMSGIGTFLGIALTTLCVFFWNYFWNEMWTFKYKNIKKSEVE